MSFITFDTFFSWALTILKWLVVVIVAANWEAIPGVWHAQVYKSAAIWLVQFAPHRLLGARRAREFLYSRMPLGKNPFETTYTYHTRCGLPDTDYNIHLSNSSYARNFDYARMHAFVEWFPSLILTGTRLGLGGSHFQFVKEIPVGTKYDIVVNIVAWEEKWFHLVAQFVTYPKKKGGANKKVEGAASSKKDLDVPPTVDSAVSSTSTSVASSGTSTPSLPLRARNVAALEKQTLSRSDSMPDSTRLPSPPRSSSGSDIEDDLFEPSSNVSTPPTSAGSTSPVMKNLKSPGDVQIGLDVAAATLAEEPRASFDMSTLPPLPEGAQLHCVHVSTYCFKQGRITVPPRVALITAGFGDPAVGRVARVKELTDTVSKSSKYRTVGAPPPAETHTVPQLMAGAWKKYESEGLWELTEYEDRNQVALDRYRPLRLALDSLRI